MFRAHRPIFRRINTAVPTTIGSWWYHQEPMVVVPQAHLQENSHSFSHNHWFLVVPPGTNGCGPTGPSSGEFTQLFPQPFVPGGTTRNQWLWSHRPIFRRIHTAVPTTIGSWWYHQEPMVMGTAV